MPVTLTDDDLRAILAEIGATPAAVTATLAGLDDAALRAAPMGGQSCLDVLREFVVASNRLGTVAHEVLGHIPASNGVPPAPDAATLHEQLRFLREHIVSTVDQQGAAVWSHPTPAGRPLHAYATDLRVRDRVLLADLTAAVRATKEN